ncbi:MAG TPA: ABC transporter substrate-binding protein [Clostridia bacterium]|nr:ABC transporter substrate-binding protein [Clostridia bacterium]
MNCAGTIRKAALTVGLLAVVWQPGCMTTNREPAQASIRPLRIGIRGSMATSNRVGALSYHATFQEQTLLYETLVKRDAEGRIVPALAAGWEFADGGRTVTLTLRKGALWHDGTPVTAEDVRIHFKRWLELPEYAWIHSSERVQELVAEGPDRLRITLSEPYALLPDLCAIRPCAVGGPGCLDRQGEWVHPVGSGPFRFVELREKGRVHRLQRVRAAGEPVKPGDVIDLVPFDAERTEEQEPFEMFRRGRLDMLVDGWKSCIPREHVAWLRGKPGVHVQEAPGSVLHYVSFRLEGPTADKNLRQHVAAAFDRAALIQQVEGGYADATHSWTAPTVKTWPQIPIPRPAGMEPRLERPLRLLGFQDHFRPRERALCDTLAAQLKQAGIPVTVELKAGEDYKQAVAGGQYDLRTEITWGVPYDPDMSVKARFLPPPFTRPTGAGNRFFGVDPRAETLARQIAATADENDRLPLYNRMQRLLSEEALVVPLYVPRRVVVIRGQEIDLPLDHDVYRDALTALSDLP